MKTIAQFQLTASRLGLNPKELIFLDDLYENIEAATNLGWHTIRVDPKNETAAVEALEEHLGVKFDFSHHPDMSWIPGKFKNVS